VRHRGLLCLDAVLMREAVPIEFSGGTYVALKVTEKR